MDLFDEAIENGCHLLGDNGVHEEAYCKEFAEFMGGGFADGVNSGTNAVFVALRGLELEPYSEVITSPVSDPGGVMPVALCNLIPVPADSTEEFYNTSAEKIAERITPRTRAILVSHLSARPIDMVPVMELAEKHGLMVIEECAQAHGTEIFGVKGEGADRKCFSRKAGTFGHVAAFSSMFGKHHSTGGQGGVVYSTSKDIYWRVRRHADRGKPFGVGLAGGAGAGVGGASGGGANAVAALNHNMDEMGACIGRVQLKKLPAMVAHRRTIAERIGEGCKGLAGVQLVMDPAWGRSSYWHLFFRFEAAAYRVPIENFVEAVTAEGISGIPSYAFYPCRMIWAKNKSVFGTSHLPWSALPDTRNPEDYPTPNAEAVDAAHFFVPLNEAWTLHDADDLVAILHKVDAAYRA
jgi:dTDP-4-amino-4,6-dideoxygalactose transaminase